MRATITPRSGKRVVGQEAIERSSLRDFAPQPEQLTMFTQASYRVFAKRTTMGSWPNMSRPGLKETVLVLYFLSLFYNVRSHIMKEWE
jgi:hypothetical protein